MAGRRGWRMCRTTALTVALCLMAACHPAAAHRPMSSASMQTQYQQRHLKQSVTSTTGGSQNANSSASTGGSQNANSSVSPVPAAVLAQPLNITAPTLPQQQSYLITNVVAAAFKPTLPVTPMQPQGTDPPNYLDAIRKDMTAMSEMSLLGLKGGWSDRPAPLRNVAAWSVPEYFKLYKYLNSWGQCYEASGGNPEPNVRIEAGNMTIWVFLIKEKQWVKARDSNNLEGRAFPQDYIGRYRPGDVRTAANGDMQFKVGRYAKSPETGSSLAGTNYHWWMRKWPPYILDGANVGGVYISQLLWLAPDDPMKPYNLSNARYLCAVGGTLIQDISKGIVTTHEPCILPKICNQQDSDIPRHKFVTAQPRQFHYLTLPMLAQINTYPPPFVPLTPKPTPPPMTVRQRLMATCPYDPAAKGKLFVGSNAPYDAYVLSGCKQYKTCDSFGAADPISQAIINYFYNLRIQQEDRMCGSYRIVGWLYNNTIKAWTKT